MYYLTAFLCAFTLVMARDHNGSSIPMKILIFVGKNEEPMLDVLVYV